MKRIVFAIMAFSVLLISCTPKIKEGEVYEKDFRPAHTSVIIMPVVTRAGKTTITRMIPMIFFYPDSWHISYRAFNEKTQKWDFATVWVPRDIYEIVQIGGWYERGESDLDNQPRIRQKN